MLSKVLRARVEPSPDGPAAFVIVFYNDECELERKPVSSKEEGEALIARVLEAIGPDVEFNCERSTGSAI